MNIKKYIFPLLIILFITVIGYSTHPFVVPQEEPVVEEPEITPNYSLEIIDVLNSFETRMDSAFAKSGCVGAAVAIVYKGQTVLIKPYGLKRLNTKDSIDIHTVFRLASVSKGFAGALAAKLHSQKVIDLDSTVKYYLPDFNLKNDFNENTVTIRNLLSHTTGVVPHSFDPVIEDGAIYNAIYNDFYRANITAKPGRIYTYQNALFSLLDTIAYLQTHKPYQELLEDSIFAPLGMFDASVSFQDFTDCDNYAFPHKYRYRGYKEVALNDRYYTVPSAAGVNASISDMSKWLQALLGHNPEVLPQEAISIISTPHVKTRIKYSHKKNWGKISNMHYGIGWRILDLGENRVMYHGGYVQGYRSEIAFCAEKQIGIAFLLNSPNKLASEVVPSFLNEFFTDTISNQKDKKILMASLENK